MRRGIFLKIAAAFLLSLAIAVVVLDVMLRLETGFWPLPRLLLWAFVVAALPAIVLAAWAASSLAKRLQRMVAFSARIAEGDLSARLEERNHDELARLAAALDSSARQLEETFSEMQASREQMLTVLNSMQEPVIAVGNDQKIRWANGSMQRLTAGRALSGAALVQALRDPDLLEAIHHCLQEGNVTTARAGLVAPGRTFDVTAAPMPGGVVAVLHDLTAIERVEKTRRDFIANVSHELRTPLTSIQGYAETLLEVVPEEGSARRFAEVIRRNSDRMARLTEDLLALARVESGEHRLAIGQVAARELLQDALQSLGETARAHGVELALDESPDARAHADPEAIHQVFANLIENALKYAASGGKILIGARLHGKELEFYVRDFGPGIASEHLPRLFERFYRVDKARSRESGGTGLGLAIVKHILLNHGGRVWAESHLGHGSSFYFTLPLASSIVEAG